MNIVYADDGGWYLDPIIGDERTWQILYPGPCLYINCGVVQNHQLVEGTLTLDGLPLDLTNFQGYCDVNYEAGVKFEKSAFCFKGQVLIKDCAMLRLKQIGPAPAGLIIDSKKKYLKNPYLDGFYFGVPESENWKIRSRIRAALDQNQKIVEDSIAHLTENEIVWMLDAFRTGSKQLDEIEKLIRILADLKLQELYVKRFHEST